MMEKRLPEGWEIVKLGDYSTIFNGKTPSKDQQREKGHPVLKIKDIDENGCFIGKFDSFVDNEFFEKNKAKCLRDGDTLILNAAHNSEYVGSKKAYILEFRDNVIPTGEWLIVRSNSELLDNRFKHFLLTSNLFKVVIKSIVKGIHLYPNDMKILKIPLPPLEMQRKIAAILETTEGTKKLRMQANELTNQLLKSVFLEMFGDPVINNKNWEMKTIEELSSEIVDCPHSTPKYVDYATDFPCIRTTELKEGYIDWKKMKYLDEHEYTKRVNRLIPIEDDVIYGREGSFGEAARVPANTNMSLGQRVMLFRPKPKVCNSVFLWALIRSNSIYFQALKKTSGSTVMHVNIKDIKKFKGICPPIELQNKFAQIAKKVEVMRQNQKHAQEYVDDLFNTLTQKAFKGELTV